MVRVDMAKWEQTLDHLRERSIGAEHVRTRERFQALYLIASGQCNAAECAKHIRRKHDTVLAWIHTYNERGPKALYYHRTGGRAPLLSIAN